MIKLREILYAFILFMVIGLTSLYGESEKVDSVLYLADSIFITPDEVVKKLQEEEPRFNSKYTLVVKTFTNDTLCIPQNDNYDFSFFNLEKGDSIWLFYPEGKQERYFTYSNNVSYTHRAKKIQEENRYIDANYNFYKDSFFNPCNIEVKLDNGEGTLWKVASYRFARTLSVDSVKNCIKTTVQSHEDINVSSKTFRQLNLLFLVFPNEWHKAFDENVPMKILSNPEELKRSLSGRSF